MRRSSIVSFFLAVVMFVGTQTPARAEVTLPSFLADHMVIQRNRPVHLWGLADPGEAVTVEFRGHHASTKADTLGQWSLHLPPGEAG
ncbi:MAG TPA: hypothetical protein VMU62_09275, partial [Acidobacteriaceae bacterium]|nr:hypothetical protein [Acidobacteriaceae bacterium]